MSKISLPIEYEQRPVYERERVEEQAISSTLRRARKCADTCNPHIRWVHVPRAGDRIQRHTFWRMSPSVSGWPYGRESKS